MLMQQSEVLGSLLGIPTTGKVTMYLALAGGGGTYRGQGTLAGMVASLLGSWRYPVEGGKGVTCRRWWASWWVPGGTGPRSPR